MDLLHGTGTHIYKVPEMGICWDTSHANVRGAKSEHFPARNEGLDLCSGD